MTKPNSTAYPRSGEHTDWGLTKREYFAAMAMQGLLANGSDVDLTLPDSTIGISRDAVEYADALIAALNKGVQQC